MSTTGKSIRTNLSRPDGISISYSPSKLAKTEEERCVWPWSKCPLKKDPGNYFLCSFHFQYGEDLVPKNDYFGFCTIKKLREFRELYKKAVQTFEENLTKDSIILTSSMKTKIKYPTAVICSRRYLRHFRANKVQYFPERQK